MVVETLVTNKPKVTLTQRFRNLIMRDHIPRDHLIVRNQLPPPRELLETVPHEELEDGDMPILVTDPFTPVGLGDRIMSLRYAIAAARHFPHREFVVHDPFGLQNLLFLDGPPNLSYRQPKGRLTTPHQLISLSNVEADFLETVRINDEKTPFNMRDALVMRHLLHLGRLDPDLYYRSIFSLSTQDLQDHPVTIDLLIMPDAKEAKIDDKSRSIKSLSPETWAVVFSQLDPTMRVAIGIGTAHPHYCEVVVEAARFAGLQNVQVVRGSLDDIVKAILSTRKFVGMDSGTTHLAAEVIKAARQRRRMIDFREVFNNRYYPFTTYGITDPEGKFKTLVYRPRGSGEDLDEINPYVVADFIQAVDPVE